METPVCGGGDDVIGVNRMLAVGKVYTTSGWSSSRRRSGLNVAMLSPPLAIVLCALPFAASLPAIGKCGVDVEEISLRWSFTLRKYADNRRKLRPGSQGRVKQIKLGGRSPPRAGALGQIPYGLTRLLRSVTR